ncbi:MAG TPA: protein kinase [Rhodocyclaceae bacterium]|nr:protein kinase [Rhodocyclaceae bacterium]
MQRIGRYDIVERIGEGSNSAVFLAMDRFGQRQVALKRVYSETLRDPVHARAQRQQLLTEAALAGRLQHPHIVQVFDVTISEDEAYLAMEYVAGGTLEAFCSPETLLPFDRLIEILFKCTRALEYAFRQGVTHRDIKPANLLLENADGCDIKVSDFGAALFKDHDRTIVVGLGSPAYMSPEQVRDDPLTHQTDIFSLGVVMYQLLTGHLPFEANNHLSLAYQINHSEAPPPSSLRPEVPPELDQIVARATHKSLTARYASWLEFSHDLAQVARTRRLFASHQPPSDTHRFQVMRVMPFFRNFDDVEIWETLRLSEWREVSAGTVIMREGEPGQYFALLANGQASICSHGMRLHSLMMGECFGEMSMFSVGGGARSADVIADSDCTLVEMRASALNHASNSCQMHFYRAFLDTLAGRLAAANERLVRL